MILCVLKHFTQEKDQFYPTTKDTIPPSASCCSVTNGQIAVKQWRKGHEKCNVETPHNEIICVLSIKAETSTAIFFLRNAE